MTYRSMIGLVICLIAPPISHGVESIDLEVDAAVITLIDEVRVPAQEAGPLAEIVTREGQRVRIGDVLARVDEQDAILELSRAQLALNHAVEIAENDIKLRQAQQRLKLADLELKNAENANKELAKVVSDSQIEKLQIERENALLGIEQAQKELAAARRGVAAAQQELKVTQRGVERRLIVAPSDGMVVEIRRRKGEWVQPGEAVVRIVKDDRLRAEGFVPADKLPISLVGQRVELWTTGPKETRRKCEGQVTFVSPEANPINGQVRIMAEFDNRESRLKAGLAIQMVIKLSPAPPQP